MTCGAMVVAQEWHSYTCIQHQTSLRPENLRTVTVTITVSFTCNFMQPGWNLVIFQKNTMPPFIFKAECRDRSSSKMSVNFYQSNWHHIQEQGDLQMFSSFWSHYTTFYWTVMNSKTQTACSNNAPVSSHDILHNCLNRANYMCHMNKGFSHCSDSASKQQSFIIIEA
jgi:hypothetical protein